MPSWDEGLKERLAGEIHDKLGEILFIDGKPLRNIEVIRANIFTTGPDGRKYRLMADHKVEQRPGMTPRITDRNQESHSFFRSIVLGSDPSGTFTKRLSQIGFEVLGAPPKFNHVIDQRKSRGYKGIDTRYNYMDTQVEVAFKEGIITGQHESGGFTYYKWIPVDEPQYVADDYAI